MDNPPLLRRSGLEKVFDVLQVLSEGSNPPTRICYRTNLSWNALYEILNGLIKIGHVEPIESGKRKEYRLTDKGMRNYLNLRNSTDELNEILKVKKANLQRPLVLVWSHNIRGGDDLV